MYGETGEFVTFIFSSVVLIGGPLSLIWFGEYISEFVDQKVDWGPAWLIKVVGWAFLLFPTIVITYYKVLR